MSSNILAVFGTLALILVLVSSKFRRPTLTNSEPPRVWSILPWVGSALSYMVGPTAFMRACRMKYGPVYKFTLGGRTLVILSTPETISSFYRQSALGNEFIISQMYKAVAGLNNGSFLYELTFRNVFPLIGECMAPHRLEQISAHFSSDLFTRIENVPTGMVVKLSDFAGRHLYDSTISALFGRRFPAKTYMDFYILDVETPTLLNKLPFITARGLAARRRLLSEIKTFLVDGWTDIRGGDILGGSPLIVRMVAELESAAISPSEIAGLILSFMWGLQGNTLRISFWLIAHLLASPDAMVQLSQEIRSAATDNYALSELAAADPRILLGNRFPLLDSAIKETIRLNILSTSMREAECDLQITGNGMTYVVKKGELVMGDVRALHFDPTVFPNPDSFQYDRFVDAQDEKSTLIGGAGPLFAWGGGAHVCKGRHFAIYAIKLFFIKTVELYDIRPLPSTKTTISVPTMNPRSIGVARTDEEIFIRLQRRRR